MDVLEQIGRAAAADGQAHAAGKRSEDMRGALQQGLRPGDAGKAGVDLRLQRGLGEVRRDCALLSCSHVEPECRGGGDTPGRGVRLLEQAGVGELGHLIAQGGRANGVPAKAESREGARADRLAGGDVASTMAVRISRCRVVMGRWHRF